MEKPFLACEKALRDALVVGRVKEGELATTSLEFEYLHRKSQCKMLIGGEKLCNYPWHVFFNDRLHSRLFHFALIVTGK